VAEGEHVRRILHCDMDCYYAAVHVRDDPSLARRPVLVGGDPEGRGVVASANYEARRFGIHSAMPASRAKRLCPDAVFLRPDFPRYRHESDRIFAIYRELTPEVETVSLDEAYLDVTDHLGEFGTATALAKEIRRRVREERGLTVSVGVGPNCLVAKIASDACKPDGLKVVPPGHVQAFLDPLPVRRLHGVGPATERALAAMGIARVAELRARPLEALLERFRSHGRTLYEFARGIDERPVEPIHERKSLGTENTYRQDMAHLEAMDEQLEAMAEEVADGLARRELAACTVTLKARYPDFTTVTRSRTFPIPTADARRIGAAAKALLRHTDAGRRSVRLLGVSASTLVPGTMRQLELFTDD
jgi:DNA polymerase-4